jgi:molybdopterin molybdotransferase
MTTSTRRSTLRDSVETHTTNALALAHPTPGVRLDLAGARGCVLADDIASPLDLPLLDNAAMDGYALRAQDVPASAGVLPVRGDIPAGPQSPTRLAPGTAQRIMTGAPVPHAADTVVQVEWTDAGTETMTVRRCPPPGANIRRAAHELRRGERTLRGGTELTPEWLAMLAALGIRDDPVHRRPRVAMLTTGSALVSPGAPRPAGTVYDANATMLAALLEQDGAVATELGHLPDDEDLLLDELAGAGAEHDLLITAGGISAGAYEVVSQALTPLGCMRFLNVAMSPGSRRDWACWGRRPSSPCRATPPPRSSPTSCSGARCYRAARGTPTRCRPGSRWLSPRRWRGEAR